MLCGKEMILSLFSLFEIRWRIVFGRSGRKLRVVRTARPSWFRIQCHDEGGIAFHLPALKGASRSFLLWWGMKDSQSKVKSDKKAKPPTCFDSIKRPSFEF